MKRASFFLMAVSILMTANTAAAFDLNDIFKLGTTVLGGFAGHSLCSNERGAIDAACTGIGAVIGYSVGNAIFRDDPRGVRAHHVAFQRAMDLRTGECERWQGDRGYRGKVCVGEDMRMRGQPGLDCRAFSAVNRTPDGFRKDHVGFACNYNRQWVPVPREQEHLMRPFQPAPYNNGYGPQPSYGGPPSPYGRY